MYKVMFEIMIATQDLVRSALTLRVTQYGSDRHVNIRNDVLT